MNTVLQEDFPDNTFIFHSGNFSKLCFSWGFPFVSFFSCIYRWQHRDSWVNAVFLFFLLSDLRPRRVLLPPGSRPVYSLLNLAFHPTDSRHWHLASMWTRGIRVIPAEPQRVNSSQPVVQAQMFGGVWEKVVGEELRTLEMYWLAFGLTHLRDRASAWSSEERFKSRGCFH